MLILFRYWTRFMSCLMGWYDWEQLPEPCVELIKSIEHDAYDNENKILDLKEKNIGIVYQAMDDLRISNALVLSRFVEILEKICTQPAEIIVLDDGNTVFREIHLTK
jgi:hypothetical protein